MRRFKTNLSVAQGRILAKLRKSSVKGHHNIETRSVLLRAVLRHRRPHLRHALKRSHLLPSAL